MSLSIGAVACHRSVDTSQVKATEGALTTPPASYIGLELGTQAVPGVQLSGAYTVEHEPDGSAFRWTSGDASFQLPAIKDAQPQTLQLTIGTFVPTRLSVVVAGRELVHRSIAVGRYTIDSDVHTIDFRSPQSVRIKSDTWRPTTPTGYTRTLGVEVRGLKLL